VPLEGDLMNTLSSRMNAACSIIKNKGKESFPTGIKVETIPDPDSQIIKIVVSCLANTHLSKRREVTLEQIERGDTKDILDFMVALPWEIVEGITAV